MTRARGGTDALRTADRSPLGRRIPDDRPVTSVRRQASVIRHTASSLRCCGAPCVRCGAHRQLADIRDGWSTRSIRLRGAATKPAGTCFTPGARVEGTLTSGFGFGATMSAADRLAPDSRLGSTGVLPGLSFWAVRRSRSDRRRRRPPPYREAIRIRPERAAAQAIMWRRKPTATACARERTFNLAKRWRICTLTVSSERKSC